MKLLCLCSLLQVIDAFTTNQNKFTSFHARFLASDSNADLFSKSTVEEKPLSITTQKVKEGLIDQAAQLRREAAEMEVAMREEARMKGVPEEMINKLVPLRGVPSVLKISPPVSQSDTSSSKKKSRLEVLSNMGKLSIGDPVRFNAELSKLRRNDLVNIWGSVLLDSSSVTSNSQLKISTGIDPKDLRLDDVGYDYQKLLVTVVVTATVLAFGSSFIGGEVGFVLGYLSALIPVGLLGVGSIAPALIGDVLSGVTLLIDREARDRFALYQAGRFLAGHAVGLPVAAMTSLASTTMAEFFQLRPTAEADENETKRKFAKKTFSQADISPYSLVCLAGSVAECMQYGKASGFSANDVNTLNALMNKVDPAMTPESAQNHIKWSALQAHSILSKYKGELMQLTEAFKRGDSLEQCIALVEGQNE